MTLLRRLAILVPLLAAACGSEPIRRERVANEPVSERAQLVVERRGMVVHEIEPLFQPVIQCELGETRRVPMPGSHAMQHCIEYADGSRAWPVINTPLVIAFDDAPVRFTDAAAVFHVGVDDRTEWVSAATPWLALDRDGSGCIESEHELFAGFDMLAKLDANQDGRIDRRDPAFGELVLWADANQDKQCTPDELTLLSFPIDLAHTNASPRPHSYEGETAVLPTRRGRVVDVYLAPARGSDRSDSNKSIAR